MASRKPYRDLSRSQQRRWEKRGEAQGLTGAQARNWARLSQGERTRYERFGRRFDLGGTEVYREPLLRTAARRHASALSQPWRYTAATLYRRREELARVARTPAGLAIAERQHPPEGLQRKWLFVGPDVFPLTADEGPWHPSLTMRAPETGPGGLGDVRNWYEESGIDWTVLSYVPNGTSRFVWVMWFPFVSPGGTSRH